MFKFQDRIRSQSQQVRQIKKIVNSKNVVDNGDDGPINKERSVVSSAVPITPRATKHIPSDFHTPRPLRVS